MLQDMPTRSGHGVRRVVLPARRAGAVPGDVSNALGAGARGPAGQVRRLATQNRCLPKMSRLLHELRSGRVLLMDGAMGTELQRAGMLPGECYELWNLTHPEEVRAIHQRYVDAGARCLLTNTFQAN